MANKPWRNAHDCAPKTCKCGARLPKPVNGYPWTSERFPYMAAPRAPIQEKVWFIKCAKCDLVYVWAWHEKSNGCWKIRAFSPLFDSQEVVVIA